MPNRQSYFSFVLLSLIIIFTATSAVAQVTAPKPSPKAGEGLLVKALYVTPGKEVRYVVYDKQTKSLRGNVQADAVYPPKTFVSVPKETVLTLVVSTPQGLSKTVDLQGGHIYDLSQQEPVQCNLALVVSNKGGFSYVGSTPQGDVAGSVGYNDGRYLLFLADNGQSQTVGGGIPGDANSGPALPGKQPDILQ